MTVQCTKHSYYPNKLPSEAVYSRESVTIYTPDTFGDVVNKVKVKALEEYFSMLAVSDMEDSMGLPARFKTLYK